MKNAPTPRHHIHLLHLPHFWQITGIASCLIFTSGCQSRFFNSDNGESNDGADVSTVVQNPETSATATEGVVPPPPSDAVLIEPHTPLRSGTGVTKKRWLMLPKDTSIKVDADNFMSVPVGTALWKEFYYTINGKDVLIERRLITKVKDSNERSDWKFQTARVAVRGEKDIIGNITIDIDSLSKLALNPQAPAPLNSQPSELIVRNSGEVKYVFPGQRMCTVCHSGAVGTYPNPKNDLMAFSLHPANLKPDSLERLTKAGYYTQESIAKLKTTAPDFTKTDPTTRLLAEFRTNCLTCHSPTRLALGSQTAFKMDPKKAFTGAQLVDFFKATSTTKEPLFNEIEKHLVGKERSPMPPQTGGVPVLKVGIDADRKALLEIYRAWRTSVGH